MLRLVALLTLSALLFQTTAANAMPKRPESVVPPRQTYIFYSHGKVVKRMRAGDNVAKMLPRGLNAYQCRPIPCVPPVLLGFCYDCG